jgi:sortase A
MQPAWSPLRSVVVDELMDEWVDASDAPPLTASSPAVAWPPPPPPPPPPRGRRRDWRWWVGGFGRILIALGVLLLGFVAYQLWGTAIQHDRSQRDLEKQFSAQLSSTVPAPTTTATSPPSSTLVPTTTVPATTVPSTTVPPTTMPPRPVFTNGDPVARLEIPRLNLNEIVVAGVGVDDLKKGPGHYPQTPLPGEPGNAAIAGHRTTYGAPFLDIDKLKPGDEIDATTYAGRFVYRVTGTQIVSPDNVSVLDNTPDDRLTLTSCDPKYSAKNRIIVTASFDAGASAPPVTAPPVTAPPVTAPPSTVAPPDSSPDNPVVTTTPPVATTAPSLVTTDDSFQRGWFDDPHAWPQVAAWGAACLAVVLAAGWIGRRTRRWVGWIVGIVPFLVPLFFFYENISRLLPPNI